MEFVLSFGSWTSLRCVVHLCFIGSGNDAQCLDYSEHFVHGNWLASLHARSTHVVRRGAIRLPTNSWRYRTARVPRRVLVPLSSPPRSDGRTSIGGTTCVCCLLCRDTSHCVVNVPISNCCYSKRLANEINSFIFFIIFFIIKRSLHSLDLGMAIGHGRSLFIETIAFHIFVAVIQWRPYHVGALLIHVSICPTTMECRVCRIFARRVTQNECPALCARIVAPFATNQSLQFSDRRRAVGRRVCAAPTTLGGSLFAALPRELSPQGLWIGSRLFLSMDRQLENAFTRILCQ